MDPFLEFKYPRFMTTEDIKNELWQLGVDTLSEDRTELEKKLTQARICPRPRMHRKYNKRGFKSY